MATPSAIKCSLRTGRCAPSQGRSLTARDGPLTLPGMPISVVCSSCKARFTVSDQFAGRTGPCPKCKKPITVPVVTAAAVTIHEPEAPAASSAAGRVPTAPMLSKEKPVSKWAFIGVGAGTLVTLLVALCSRIAWGPGHVPAWMLASGAILPAVPVAWIGYRLVRDRELEPYAGRSLLVRCGICGMVYAALWGVHALLPPNLTAEYWQWMYVGPVFLLAGALAALAALDLDWGAGAIHYSLYVLLTCFLRWITGLPPL